METDHTPPARAKLERSDEAAPGVRTNMEGLGSLASGIIEDLQGIVRGEVQLAKTELRQDISSIGKGIAVLAVGAMVAFVGFELLMLALTFLLNKWLELWISALIVGGALVIIGTIAALIGKSRLSAANLKPEQTIDSLKEDQQWANRQIKSVKK